MTVPNQQRLGLLRVSTGDGKYRTGTGYAVTKNLLLTAHHVVFGDTGTDDPVEIEVMLQDGKEQWQPADLHWPNQSGKVQHDACLLRLCEPCSGRDQLTWGFFDHSQNVEWESAGFPRASIFSEDAEQEICDVAGVSGEMLVFGASRRGQYELTVKAATHPKLWGGVSGAPIFVDGHLVGVMRAASRAYKGERLSAVPVQPLFQCETFRQALGDPELAIVPASPLQRQIIEKPSKYKSPGVLLTARNRMVAFDQPSRAVEWGILEEWCHQDDEFAIRLLTGPGGAGKTRLCIEWCAELRRQGWQAGFLPTETLDDPAWKRLLQGTLPTLVVIDYAETQPELSKLLRRMCEETRLERLRIILLARGIADWWSALLQNSEPTLKAHLKAYEPTMLMPVTAEGDVREQIYENAYRAFGFHLQRPVQEPPPRIMPMEDKHFGRILYLHMAALAAVEGLHVTAETLLEDVVTHEQKYWCQAFLSNAKDREERKFRQKASRLIGAITLRGGASSKREAKSLNGRVDGPSEDFLTALEDLYPGRSEEEAGYLSPLEPDLLGEALVIRVLRDGGQDYLNHVFEDESLSASKKGFEVLGRISTYTNDGRQWLEWLLQGQVKQRALHAFEAAMSLGTETAHSPLGQVLAEALEQEGTLEVAQQLEPLLLERTVSLREVNFWVAHRLFQASPEDTNLYALAKRAEYLNNLGNRSGELGEREEALAATLEAVDIRRKLANQRPDVFLPDLAGSLNNLSAMYRELGKGEDALVAAKEAVEKYRELANQRPDAFLPGLAMSINNLGNGYSQLGKNEEALAATLEAVDIRRKLAVQRPDAFIPDLAGSLIDLGTMYSQLGKREEALAAAKEAVDICRELAKQRPDASLPNLATSLNNLGIMYSELGKREDAFEATKEAVDIHRELAKQRPDVFLPYLAGSLTNLGNRYRALGKREEALAAVLEAVEKYRELARQRPDVFLPNLAGNLNNLGTMYSDLGKREEALATVLEAVEKYRKLENQGSDAFLPYLAMILNNLGASYSELGKREEALATVLEAVEKYRKLANQRPDAFLPNLAGSLNDLGKMYSELGKREEALAITLEAVDIRRELAKQRPNVFLPDLAGSLNDLGNRYSELGQMEAALSAAKEAVEKYRKQANQRPDVFLPGLAMSLNNLGNRYRELGKREDALAVALEAVEKYRGLVKQRPDVFLPNLAMSLNNLGASYSELGKREEALAAALEAVEKYRELAKQRPDVFLPELAGNLNNLGAMYSQLGKMEEALVAVLEAVEKYRELAKQRPDVFLPNLAMSLLNLGNGYSQLYKKDDALVAAREAVRLYHRLVERLPAAFLQNFRMSLQSLAKRLQESDVPPESDDIFVQAFAWLQRHRSESYENQAIK